MPRIIGLTGGIASGKSTVSKIWKQEGAYIIDADVIARNVVAPGSLSLNLIRWRFGDSIISSDGSLDRKALGRIIFGDGAARRTLNLLTHPFIIGKMILHVICALIQFHPVIVLDTPLLFETRNLLPFCQKVVVVYCSPEQQLERLLTRDGSTLSTEDAKQRISSQMDLEEKKRLADYVLDNTASQDILATKARELLYLLRPTAAKEFIFRAIVISICAGSFFAVGKYVRCSEFHKS